MDSARFRIGTAGWNIPRSDDGFPSDGSQLERYAFVFNAVEINSSFYRPHRRTTYVRWADSTPDDFRFAVKMPRALTHEARLSPPLERLDQFLEEASGLGAKLGVWLVQLPPSLAYDAGTADRFFQVLRERSAAPIVCEPRHRSWFNDAVERRLKELQIGRVAADPAIVPAAALPGGSDDVIYLRLHGSPRTYYSRYSAKQMQETARQMQSFRQASAVWCIFDNTAEGAALPNAREVMTELGIQKR